MAFVCTLPAVPTVQQDDSAVRITRWDFEPGATTTWHEHPWPYLVVMLDEGVLRIDDGETVAERSLTRGESYIRPAGVRHDVMNGSSHPVAFIEIEFKRPGALYPQHGG